MALKHAVMCVHLRNLVIHVPELLEGTWQADRSSFHLKYTQKFRVGILYPLTPLYHFSSDYIIQGKSQFYKSKNDFEASRYGIYIYI